MDAGVDGGGIRAVEELDPAAAAATAAAAAAAATASVDVRPIDCIAAALANDLGEEADTAIMVLSCCSSSLLAHDFSALSAISPIARSLASGTNRSPYTQLLSIFPIENNPLTLDSSEAIIDDSLPHMRSVCTTVLTASRHALSMIIWAAD